MKPFSAILAVTLVAAAAWPAIAMAASTVKKTWVSSTGSDTGSCQLAAPCKTFAYALSQTSDGGEIDVKDSGAYGGFTIAAKSVTVVADGVVASVGVQPGGTAAITILGDSSVAVTISGLTVNTHSDAADGVHIDCGCRVVLDHLNVQGSRTGIDVAMVYLAVISNGLISTNQTGVRQAYTDGGNARLGHGDVYLSNDVIATNGCGIVDASIYSFRNNVLKGNTTGDVCAGSSLVSAGLQ